LSGGNKSTLVKKNERKPEAKRTTKTYREGSYQLLVRKKSNKKRVGGHYVMTPRVNRQKHKRGAGKPVSAAKGGK